MIKKQLIVAWLILISMVLVTSGCGWIINAGIAYGIYKATK